MVAPILAEQGRGFVVTPILEEQGKGFMVVPILAEQGRDFVVAPILAELITKQCPAFCSIQVLFSGPAHGGD